MILLLLLFVVSNINFIDILFL